MLSSLVLALVLPHVATPVAYWKTREDRYQNGQIFSLTGPNLMVSGFPRTGKVVERGTVYVVVGGGGGDLEQFAPTRQTFSHTVRTGHHFGIVSADPRTFEFRAYDSQGRLFDSFTLAK